MSTARFRTRWPRRGSAASRATMTMADQCVASASNFAVGIIVARISGPSGLGAFALAYTVWILLTTLHRALITDPMAIMGDMRGDEKEEFVRRGYAADITLGLMAAGIIAAVGSGLLVVGQDTFGVGLLSVAPWVIMLDLQDYWRFIGFMQGNPKKSLVNDLLFNAVQALAFGIVLIAGLHSVFAVIAAWGLGATAAALYGLRQFSVRPSLRGGSAFLWSRWPISQWLASERVASWGASQLYLILAGVMLGPAALGGLKAAQGLVAGPTTLVINAGGSFGLPEATKHLAEGSWAGMMRVTRLVTGAGVAASVACGVVVFLAAPELLKLLYGPEFVKFAPCARLFAISVVLSAFNVGPIITLTAARRVRPLFFLQLGKLAFGIAAVTVLAAAYGVTGAAGAYVLTVALATIAIVPLQSWTRRSLEGPTSRSATDVVRSRLVRNTRLLLALSEMTQNVQPPSEPTEFQL